MSTRTSTTNLNAEDAYPTILEKIESQRAPGELTPVPPASPALSTDERLDEKEDSPSHLEAGRPKQSEGRPPITHRPTGFRVYSR
jgi:hypothetical protein